MKYIDKFLKLLKTDRNTFLTYVLTLLSFYFVIDRLVEILFLIFTGMSVSYWGPFMYTFALACPVFAFLFSSSSSYATSNKVKLSFFYIYVIGFYVIAISMITQWLNQLIWMGLLSLPGYPVIATEFSQLIKSALSSIAVYFPLTTVYPLFKFLFVTVNDTKLLKESIGDYGGINLADKSKGLGQYTCEVVLGTDRELGRKILIPESSRFSQLFVAGPSGSGKTSLVFEPMIASDIDRKFFFKQIAKEMGFTALKTGIATLNKPYSNSYLNKNFNLTMLTPNPNKLSLYKAYMNKMIYAQSGDKIVYRNLGITSISPDYETISHMVEVAENYNIPVNIIDPNNPDSLGLNPFVYDDPLQTAVAISSVLKGMYSTTTQVDVEEAFRENVAAQAVESLSILLKEMYPRLHDDSLPNLEDMLKMLTNFDLVETMCEEMQTFPELVEQYSIQLAYFKKNFYKDGTGRADTEKFVYSAVTQLDNLLRYPGIKSILCNRNNNLNYDKALEDGDITFICTRRGDLGATAHKAFGLFFILLMQYSVLRRPGNEELRIPHFLYIDEFGDFVGKATEPIFTIYRKYKVASSISVQNLSQLGADQTRYRQTILSNSINKIVFGGNTPEENEYWSKDFGNKRDWKSKRDYDVDKTEYTSKLGDISWGWKKNFEADKIRALRFKACIYKVRTTSGGLEIGPGKLDFMASKYKEKHTEKTYNFDKFTSGIAEEEKVKKTKTSYKPTHFSDDATTDVDPINTDTTDSEYFLNNDDAIIFDLKKGNPNG